MCQEASAKRESQTVCRLPVPELSGLGESRLEDATVEAENYLMYTFLVLPHFKTDLLSPSPFLSLNSPTCRGVILCHRISATSGFW